MIPAREKKPKTRLQREADDDDNARIKNLRTKTVQRKVKKHSSVWRRKRMLPGRCVNMTSRDTTERRSIVLLWHVGNSFPRREDAKRERDKIEEIRALTTITDTGCPCGPVARSQKSNSCNRTGQRTHPHSRGVQHEKRFCTQRKTALEPEAGAYDDPLQSCCGTGPEKPKPTKAVVRREKNSSP